MSNDSPEAAGELAALDDILFALYNSPRDGTKLIERFGSYRGIYDATENELKTVGGLQGRGASFFVYGKRFVKQALLREIKGSTARSEYEVMLYAAAHFFGENRAAERMLCLDKSGAVENIVCLNESAALKDVVGRAVLDRVHTLIWLRYDPNGSGASIDKKRKSDIERAHGALKTLGIEMLDYIEFRPPYFYSAKAAKRGDGFIDGKTADRTPYKEFTIPSKEVKTRGEKQ